MPFEWWLELMTSDKWTDRLIDKDQRNSIDPCPLAPEGHMRQ